MNKNCLHPQIIYLKAQTKGKGLVFGGDGKRRALYVENKNCKTALMKTGVYYSKLNDFGCSKLNQSSSAWNLCYCMKDRSFFPLYCLSHQQICFFPHFETSLHLTFPSTVFLTFLLQQKSSKFLSTTVDVSFPLRLVSLESSSSNSWCSRLHPNLPCCQAHQ